MNTEQEAAAFLKRMNEYAEQGKPIAVALRSAIYKKAGKG